MQPEEPTPEMNVALRGAPSIALIDQSRSSARGYF
jgi:hypothetical protein